MRSLLVIPDSVATRGGLRLATLVPCALLVVSLSGCWNSTDNSVADATTAHVDDDVAVTEADVDMPADFAAAVDRIKDYRARIFAAVAAGTPHDAHRPLDEMDIVIGKLMPIARDSGVPRGDWEEVNVARREVRAQFDLVHVAIDHDERPDMAAVQPAIAAAIERLEDVAAKLAPRDRDQSRQKPASQEALP